jgi:hypothetical protein
MISTESGEIPATVFELIDSSSLAALISGNPKYF